MLRQYLHSAAATRPFRVLALETSADDTCAAIVDSSRRIWSNVVVNQHYLHEGYGGIQPLVAMHAHQRNIPTVVRQALTDANLQMADIDGVAFTRGPGPLTTLFFTAFSLVPGLPGCLSIGLNAAKTLAAATCKPLVGVHHMQAHALTAHLTTDPAPEFPFLTLLVSGGHTMIVLATSMHEFRIIANTVDRSIGSTIDRCATLLQIKWPQDLGPGPGLERFCAEDVPDEAGAPHFQAPTIMRGQLAFSFTALHSWVERTINAAGGTEHVPRRALARAFQNAAFAELETKLLLALKWCETHHHAVRHLVVSGGVASNTLLRQRLKTCVSRTRFMEMKLVFPDPSFCTDNAAMIAWASMHRFLAQDHDQFTIAPLPKWSIEAIRNPPTSTMNLFP
ncbi:glycoprotease family-domain-containing protein [Mycena maculata]|uniref:N(6)-L-threonylcarbamoyladenine synthase n=1 Tax=Mycena maculata TaxID=230809 RepID=A0AAD7J2W5_9AGAR|nr:glycoprotease family-domain-containing protein [Mycena maculata]